MKTSNSFSKTKLTAFILAFDRDSSMHSPLSRYMHPVAGIPMVLRVFKALRGLSDQQELPIELDINIVTTKDTHSQIKESLSSHSVSYIQHSHLKNVIDSIKSALTARCDSQAVLFVSADSFLLQINDLISIIKSFQKSSKDLTIALSTQNLALKHQMEQAARNNTVSDFSRKINIYILEKTIINDIFSLSHSHQKDDLTVSLADMFFRFSQQNPEKVSYLPLSEDISYPVESQQELATATKKVFYKKAMQLMDRGVVIIDPESTYIEDDVDIKPTTIIYPNTYILGNSQIAEGCEVEPNAIIRNSKIGCGVKVKAGSYLENAIVESHSLIGPYARLRSETHIGSHCKIGNFVETKKAIIADHVKASHLSYLGDVEIGSNVNIGCGTITCNYREDHKKYKTLIEDNVFVGSDVQLIAPIRVGKGSVIGSGSTITNEIPPNSLAIARAKQVIKTDRTANNKSQRVKDPSKD